MEAIRLKQVDLDYRCHLIAWLTFSAKAEKKAGKNKTKPVYDKFNKFFNYEKELQKVTSKKEVKSRFSGIGRLLKKGE